MSEVSNWAVINNGVVEKVVLWDGVSEWKPCHEDDEVIDVSDLHISPGWLYAEGHFSNFEPDGVE